jgi:hypothetical protein
VNPHDGQRAVDEARRLVSAGRVRGLKLHPPLQQLRTAASPHFAGMLRKNFSPPQSPRYDIGSLQAEVPSMNSYS